MRCAVFLLVLALIVSLISLTNGFFANAFLRGASPNNLCSIPPVPYASPKQITARLRTALNQYAKKLAQIVATDVGGTVVNLIYKDTVIWSKGFGARNMSGEVESGLGNAVDGDTIFRIGSITKVCTAMMMLQLRDEGSISSLDSEVVEILPEFKIKNPFKQKRAITLNQLSSHMSGLPRETPCPGIFVTGCSLPFEEIYDRLSKMELIYPPGTWPQYSNLGVALVGRALEKISGKSWKNMLEERILKPLGMNTTVYSVDPSMMDRLAVGYAPNGTVADLVDIGFEAPAGQLYSTANDLSKLMMSIMNNIDSTRPLKNSLLDSETLREWMEPVYTYKDGTGYGRPWELMPSFNYTLRTKAGTINGYEAEFLMFPEIQTGAVVMKSCLGCPSFGSEVTIAAAMINSVAYHLLDSDLLPPVKLPPDPQFYVGTFIGFIMSVQKIELSVTVGKVNGQTVLLLEESGVSVKLDWREDLGQDMFQVSGKGMSLPCGFISYGTLGEYVEFLHYPGGGVTQLTIEGLFPGNIFVKKQ